MLAKTARALAESFLDLEHSTVVAERLLAVARGRAPSSLRDTDAIATRLHIGTEPTSAPGSSLSSGLSDNATTLGQNQPRFSIWFGDMGAGHRTAAQAVDAGIKEVWHARGMQGQPGIELDNVFEKSSLPNRIVSHTYNWLLRNHQDYVAPLYHVAQATNASSWRINQYFAGQYFEQAFRQQNPSAIVSVFPFINHAVASELKDRNLTGKVKLINLITDPNENLLRGWASPGADLVIAPNDLAADKLVSWGVNQDKVKVIGMPVHPDFLKPPAVSRHDFLTNLGLDPDRPTIALNAGSAGGGNILDIYHALSRQDRGYQTLFMSGRNPRLYERATDEAKLARTPTAVTPFRTDMPDLMNACDLMVTKAGGLTTAQCVARHLPMALDLITKPMPQERGTAKILIEQGLAAGIKRPEDAVRIVDEQLPAMHERMQNLPSAHNLNRTDAIYDISREILDIAMH